MKEGLSVFFLIQALHMLADGESLENVEIIQSGGLKTLSDLAMKSS